MKLIPQLLTMKNIKNRELLKQTNHIKALTQASEKKN